MLCNQISDGYDSNHTAPEGPPVPTLPRIPSSRVLDVGHWHSSSLSLCVLDDRNVATAFPRLWSVGPFIRGFPLSGAIWLRYLKTKHGSATAGSVRQVGKWTVASAVASGAMMLALWYPGRAYSLVRPRDISSVSIEMSRGPCFGSCPMPPHAAWPISRELPVDPDRDHR